MWMETAVLDFFDRKNSLPHFSAVIEEELTNSFPCKQAPPEAPAALKIFIDVSGILFLHLLNLANSILTTPDSNRITSLFYPLISQYL